MKVEFDHYFGHGYFILFSVQYEWDRFFHKSTKRLEVIFLNLEIAVLWGDGD